MKAILKKLISTLFVLFIVITVCACDEFDLNKTSTSIELPNEQSNINFNIPKYNRKVAEALNNNIPWFSKKDLETYSGIQLSELDNLGRTKVAIAVVSKATMPTGERNDLDHITPSGWKNSKYEGIVDQDFCYNRCHLIGWQLCGNDEAKNIITGTRYFNTEGMLPYENMIANYIRLNIGSVLYRVTPCYEGNELVARGVIMEAYSVDDNGASICFNVFVHNIQPKITIDYATGNNWLTVNEETSQELQKVILNENNKKIHYEWCESVAQISEKNKKEYTGIVADLKQQGYTSCGSCNPQ